MAGAIGFVNPDLGFSDQKTIDVPTRYIADIAGFVPFEEQHTDVLEITEHPIEQGARIADHAFKYPAKVTIKFGWSNSTVGGTSGSSHAGVEVGQVAEIYQKLLGLQAAREPFPVMTGKRLYENMLIKELSVQTDKETENVLMVTAVFQEILLVTTSSVLVESVPASAQADPEATQATSSTGNKQLQSSSGANAESALSISGRE